MNIHIVRDNLKNTIAGKEKMLESVREGGTTTVSHTIIHMLNINIDELKKILADVEKCVEQANIDSWTTNPDRMGGQFTQDEIDNSGRWI